MSHRQTGFSKNWNEIALVLLNRKFYYYHLVFSIYSSTIVSFGI